MTIKSKNASLYIQSENTCTWYIIHLLMINEISFSSFLKFFIHLNTKNRNIKFHHI